MEKNGNAFFAFRPVAQAKEFAKEHGIDLGDATIWAKVKTDGSTEPGLRALGFIRPMKSL